MSTVAVEKLTKRFDRLRAVDDIDLVVPEGSFTALLGPSGCGKSTLLRLVAGLERPSAGRIRIGEEDVTEIAPERRRVGMMFQSYALFPHMSVANNLAFPLRMGGTRDGAEIAKRVAWALELVRLPDIGERGIRQLSGGQQQRVALARAFIANPRVLLLDEPLSNLDARLREDMQVELIELHRELGLTTIFVTHDQEEALSLADHVVLMREGRIEQEGAPEALYARPATAFAADFIGAANLVEAQVREANGGWTAMIAGIKVPTTAPPDGRAGRRTLMIRQEDIAIGEPPAGRAALPARVKTRVYLGAKARYVVRAGDLVLTAITPKQTPARAGDACTIHWDPADAAVL